MSAIYGPNVFIFCALFAYCIDYQDITPRILCYFCPVLCSVRDKKMSKMLTQHVQNFISTGDLTFFHFFHKRLRICNRFFTHLLYVPMHARLQIFIQLSPTLTKLCHIKRDYPVHIICAKCPKRAHSDVCVSR